NSSENVTKLALLTVKDRTLFSIFNHYKLDKLDQLTKQILVTEVSSSIRSVNRAINECIKE
ncbi:Crp/Fnr family transcriptional regulator, partial [Staphylococcus aureus]|nr:Crp/Fnr family transcriptional regulator [Staphylococcus aureus]